MFSRIIETTALVFVLGVIAGAVAIVLYDGTLISALMGVSPR